MRNIDLYLSKIEKIANNSIKFKIGETGQNIDSRFRGLEYSEYDEIIEITYSKDRILIDEIESRLIETFINYPNCMNKKGGSAGQMTYSYRYSIYVVFTPKKNWFKRIITFLNK